MRRKLNPDKFLIVQVMLNKEHMNSPTTVLTTKDGKTILATGVKLELVDGEMELTLTLRPEAYELECVSSDNPLYQERVEITRASHKEIYEKDSVIPK